MNPLAIIGFIVAIVVGYFSLSGSGTGPFGGSGPIATGSRSSEIRDPQPIATPGSVFQREATLERRPAPPSPRPGDSPYQGTVRIASVERSGDRPESEYVVIRAAGGFFRAGSDENPAIDVTGWRIESLRASGVIPRAFNIPEIDALEEDVILPPGGELIVLTGTPIYARNFRENQCAGYFNQSHSFTPSLSDSCGDSRISRSALLRMGFNGACIDAVESVSACRTPRGPFLVGVITQECLDYMNKNFSYVGCVANLRDGKDFLKPKWRVSLKRSQKLFDSRHDRVVLRDQSGLRVDEFEY